ncbi:helix-turn-helix domain-containing protein [Brachybacterium sp. J144]|uniref:helix-turn-helix transcriptional regulator n=1 Tax=Brachybacterium sp. J144 TaxID=3116487 RepID=UPI002E75F8ED|nr:helix-turn-helix domain-containing protein [Brachybacterium sp. J144]MEE1651831.1 helix-turn-helix domain-containing protein [Brachybacterium sp. J144]
MSTATLTTDRLLTEAETAELLGLEPGTLRSWRSSGKQGQPPFVRLGRQVRYRASDLAEYMAALTAGEGL